MLEIIEAPNKPQEENELKLFLAGGITNCPDWQAELIEKMKAEKKEYDKYLLDQVTVLNPRRKNFPIDDPNASVEQITWEYKGLRESDIIVFWFSKGSLNPIVLYELGKHGTSQPTKIVIGCDEEYERISDVEIQTKLARPEQEIVYNLDKFYAKIIKAIHDLITAKNKKSK
jgi:hypothetical protein